MVGGCLDPVRSDWRRHRERCAKQHGTVHTPDNRRAPDNAIDQAGPSLASRPTPRRLHSIVWCGSEAVVRGDRWPWRTSRHDHLRERSSLPGFR
eukprot:6211199-Pleurochrysis_carterae.AAC.2